MVHGLLISELLPNHKLETSVLSICLTMSTLQFTILYGLGAAASTQVSKVIGAGNHHAARVVIRAVMFLAIIKAIIASMSLLSFHHFHGKVHSDEKPVVSYVASVTPFISLSIITESLEAVNSGIASGGGWRHIGGSICNSWSNLSVWDPMLFTGVSFTFENKGTLHWDFVGSIIQFTSISLITGLTDWRTQATKAKERMLNVSA